MNTVFWLGKIKTPIYMSFYNNLGVKLKVI